MLYACIIIRTNDLYVTPAQTYCMHSAVAICAEEMLVSVKRWNASTKCITAYSKTSILTGDMIIMYMSQCIYMWVSLFYD